MRILVKDIKEDASESLLYIMDGNVPVEAHILNPRQLEEMLNNFSDLIKLGSFGYERMSYNNYINQ
jgi:hypothetical protein